MEEVSAQMDSTPVPTLKGRQRDCMMLVKEGLSSKQIARRLGISPRTVDQHIAAAMEALGVPNRMAAVSELYRLEREAAGAPASMLFLQPDSLIVAQAPVPARTSGPRARRIVPPLGGSANTATRAERIAWIVRLTVFCVMATCTFVLSILGVSEMAKGLVR